MTTDDDMREIEAALSRFVTDAIYMDTQWLTQRDSLLALIRSKLPQADAAVQKPTNPVTVSSSDAEHERAVEAWRSVVLTWTDDGERYCISRGQLADALRLMRARPAVDKALDLERYGPAPTMQAMEPSPEWLARHTAAADLRDALVLAASQLRVFAAKRAEAPESADLHLDEALATLCMFGKDLDGTYPNEVAALRQEVQGELRAIYSLPVAQEKAVGELLRAAKALSLGAVPIEESRFVVGDLDGLRTAIEGAERGGIGKQHQD